MTVMKFLGCTTDFPTWGSGKEAEIPPGIWFWRSVAFDYRTSTWLGKQTLGGHKQTCTHQKPGEGSSDPRKDWVRLACECPGVPGRSVGRGTDYNSAGITPFEGGLHYPYLSLVSGQTTGRNTDPHINRKLDYRFAEHSPEHQKKTHIPPQPVCPIRKLLQASYPPEGRQNANHNHRKLTKLITWTKALSSSMKLWAMPFRATQDGWVMVESSDKTWSMGEGNGKPLQSPCHETPWTVWKGNKIWHWKMNSPDQ